MITANEANRIARDKVEADRRRALSMVENFIEISAKCGKFQATIATDEVITLDTLEEIEKTYRELGYECIKKSCKDSDTTLTIMW